MLVTDAERGVRSGRLSNRSAEANHLANNTLLTVWNADEELTATLREGTSVDVCAFHMRRAKFAFLRARHHDPHGTRAPRRGAIATLLAQLLAPLVRLLYFLSQVFLLSPATRLGFAHPSMRATLGPVSTSDPLPSGSTVLARLGCALAPASGPAVVAAAFASPQQQSPPPPPSTATATASQQLQPQPSLSPVVVAGQPPLSLFPALEPSVPPSPAITEHPTTKFPQPVQLVQPCASCPATPQSTPYGEPSSALTLPLPHARPSSSDSDGSAIPMTPAVASPAAHETPHTEPPPRHASASTSRTPSSKMLLAYHRLGTASPAQVLGHNPVSTPRPAASPHLRPGRARFRALHALCRRGSTVAAVAAASAPAPATTTTVLPARHARDTFLSPPPASLMVTMPPGPTVCVDDAVKGSLATLLRGDVAWVGQALGLLLPPLPRMVQQQPPKQSSPLLPPNVVAAPEAAVGGAPGMEVCKNLALTKRPRCAREIGHTAGVGSDGNGSGDSDGGVLYCSGTASANSSPVVDAAEQGTAEATTLATSSSSVSIPSVTAAPFAACGGAAALYTPVFIPLATTRATTWAVWPTQPAAIASSPSTGRGATAGLFVPRRCIHAAALLAVVPQPVAGMEFDWAGVVIGRLCLMPRQGAISMRLTSLSPCSFPGTTPLQESPSRPGMSTLTVFGCDPSAVLVALTITHSTAFFPYPPALFPCGRIMAAANLVVDFYDANTGVCA